MNTLIWFLIISISAIILFEIVGMYFGEQIAAWQIDREEKKRNRQYEIEDLKAAIGKIERERCD